MPDLFIPKRIRVGFVKREDTFTKRLAYVICYDVKGKLRKEKSWESWRDKKIEPEEFDNTPHSGFILNKGHTRYSWSHFGSNHTVIRVYDDRGIEFEITPENLVGLLMETTCSKRVIEGECVYAWAGKNLVLLPVGSEAYKLAQDNTSRQDMKISAKDLKAGCSYTTKKNEEVIYLGRYNWYKWDTKKGREAKKSHIFALGKKPESSYVKYIFPKENIDFLAINNSFEPVKNYAELIDQFNKDIHSSSIVDWKSEKCNATLEVVEDETYLSHKRIKKSIYTKMNDNKIDFYRLGIDQSYNSLKEIYQIDGYRMVNVGTLNKDTFIYFDNKSYDDGFGYIKYSLMMSEAKVIEELQKMDDIYMVLENGNKILLENFESFAYNSY